MKTITLFILLSAVMLSGQSEIFLIMDEAGSGDRPYKVYTALLTQSGTDAPVATVLENTLGGTVVWTRGQVAGVYVETLAGAFPPDKVWCIIGYGLQDGGIHTMFYWQNNADAITFYHNLNNPEGESVNQVDGYMDMYSDYIPAKIEIRVYP